MLFILLRARFDGLEGCILLLRNYVVLSIN